MEAQSLKTGYDLTELCVGELAGDRRRNNGINSVAVRTGIGSACFKDLDSVDYVGFVGYCAEGALINACSALNALGIVDLCRLLVVHGDGFYLAGILAGALAAYDCGIGADLCACSALFAL